VASLNYTLHQLGDLRVSHSILWLCEQQNNTKEIKAKKAKNNKNDLQQKK
jgi:hypothetical protein